MGDQTKQRYVRGKMSWWKGNEKVVRTHCIHYELVNEQISTEKNVKTEK